MPLVLWIDIGRCIRRFVDAGVHHADLNAHNVLLDSEDRVWLVDKAVLRFTDDVVRNVKASDRNLKAVQAFLTPGALVELTLTIGYYMMVCRFLESMGVDGEEGQAEWLKTAKL